MTSGFDRACLRGRAFEMLRGRRLLPLEIGRLRERSSGGGERKTGKYMERLDRSDRLD